MPRTFKILSLKIFSSADQSSTSRYFWEHWLMALYGLLNAYIFSYRGQILHTLIMIEMESKSYMVLRTTEHSMAREPMIRGRILETVFLRTVLHATEHCYITYLKTFILRFEIGYPACKLCYTYVFLCD